MRFLAPAIATLACAAPLSCATQAPKAPPALGEGSFSSIEFVVSGIVSLRGGAARRGADGSLHVDSPGGGREIEVDLPNSGTRTAGGEVDFHELGGGGGGEVGLEDVQPFDEAEASRLKNELGETSSYDLRSRQGRWDLSAPGWTTLHARVAAVTSGDDGSYLARLTDVLFDGAARAVPTVVIRSGVSR